MIGVMGDLHRIARFFGAIILRINGVTISPAESGSEAKRFWDAVG